MTNGNNAWGLHLGVALQVLSEQAADLRKPAIDQPGLLNRLERCQVPRFADAVRLLDPEVS
jgi:hypothetical protein